MFRMLDAEFACIIYDGKTQGYIAARDPIGIRPDYDGLIVDPCIPSFMDGFTAKRDFRGTTYHIEVENPDHVEKGVASVTVDGNAFEGNLIPVDAGKKEVHVKVIMG